MSEKKPTGFPILVGELRDEIAMRAMHGVLRAHFKKEEAAQIDQLAKQSYEIADAMLEARKR